MHKNITTSLIIALFFIGGAGYFSFSKKNGTSLLMTDTAFAAKFDMVSKNGNSSCSGTFANSIDIMPDGGRLRGSCCSPMDRHRYEEQVNGLKIYGDIPEIPSDPYDIDTGLAKMLKDYYDVELTSEQQRAYDYAMQNSMEKGPCCCKCWRWYVYGGLAKLLIQKYNFTGEQVTEVWNLSDGCGGAGDHASH
ncbi:MAG: hypothetical protein A2719_01870 [Candidatus Ryanbacteria bacterium RIFCSPHIGHO2_01_FULL_45_22]|uniref:Uncharacterized protein n=2 Tax=Candidatus Ryaniibacteriota TaxID=1817914 RepID=A0A1G2FZR4_9BACT|nr:MAG: hypothetical protein A2719_01870 [Candidatus Ryanbacteria bacterium RIFCSPHIGHO2_01_FULL_45_22]OGZ45369.1 MAG: hypothetical protein A3J54_03965 [Candidatus Ryanbacteria bacterium RIFCSPHIGHO2_02_FULL_45_13b]